MALVFVFAFAFLFVSVHLDHGPKTGGVEVICWHWHLGICICICICIICVSICITRPWTKERRSGGHLMALASPPCWWTSDGTPGLEKDKIFLKRIYSLQICRTC